MFTKLEEFTEAEFLAYLKELWDAEFKSEAESVEAVRKFVAIADHPSGSDLLFFLLLLVLIHLRVFCRRSKSGGPPMASRCSRASSSLQL